MVFAFPPFELDPERRLLTRDGEPLAIPDRHIDILVLLLARAGQIVAKDELLDAGWKDVAVGDNSLEQAISSLRRTLGGGFIDTLPRRGYRFAPPVSRVAPRATDVSLEALLAPHRAFVEGRAALETLEGGQVARARRVFEEALAAGADYAPAHIGLANACAMQFEMTRTDARPDEGALARAMRHARDACRLAPASGEAWATLGFVLGRGGRDIDALAAARRAVSLEPDNWRHHLRLAYTGWGEERLSSAHRTLALLPHFPLAHWLAATVQVARQVPHEAARELAAGIAADAEHAGAGARFSAVALHWLFGLVKLADGDEDGAVAELERELAREDSGHLYARECCANVWYALGAIRLRQGRRQDAVHAFDQAIARVATHPMARAALAAIAGEASPASASGGHTSDAAAGPVEVRLAAAVPLVIANRHDQAARLVDAVLASALPGNAGWFLPVEPLLNVRARPDVWAAPLARVRNRAA
jgi:DNA-binding winged helix-turn-helix (wHTH) protein/Tfp pilus assembly protein PilF